MALTGQYPAALSFTINKWVSDNFSDLLSSNSALLTKLRLNQKVTAGFGNYIQEPLMFNNGSDPTAVGVSNPFTYSVSYTDSTGFDSARYQAAYYFLGVTVADRVMHENQGDAQKISVVQGYTQKALQQTIEVLNGHLWAAPENTKSAGSVDQLASILTLINAGGGSTTGGYLAEQNTTAVCAAASQTAVTSVGGIERNASSAGQFCSPLIKTSDTFSIEVLSKIYNKGVRGTSHPDLIIMHPDTYSAFESLISFGGSNGGQMLGPSALATAGFPAIRYKQADVIFDNAMPSTCYLSGSSTQYGVNLIAMNTDHFALRVVSDKPQLQEISVKEPVHFWKGFWMGQLTTDNPGFSGAVRHVNLVNP